LSDRPLPGARALIGRLDEAGVPYLFATNNSSVPGARYVERLRGLGIAAERAHVLTSNDAMLARLRREGVTRAFLVATEAVRAEYAAARVRHDHADPQAVVLTFDTTLDYAKVRTAPDLPRTALPHLAPHAHRPGARLRRVHRAVRRRHRARARGNRQAQRRDGRRDPRAPGDPGGGARGRAAGTRGVRRRQALHRRAHGQRARLPRRPDA